MTMNAWIATIIGGAFLLLLGALAIVLIINADLRASVVTADAARSLLQAQNKEWAQKTAATNAALAKIKTMDAANARAIAKAETAATAAEKKLKDQAAGLAGLKLTGSDCEQVMTLRKFYLEQGR